MAQICKNLNVLYVYNYCQDILGLISLIDTQRYLKNVSFYCHNIKGACEEETSNALAKKGSTIITRISWYYFTFIFNITYQSKIFKNLS
jgi:hypothetical protein